MEVWTGLPSAHGQRGAATCLPVPGDAAACPTGTAKWTTPTKESLQIGHSDAVPTTWSIDTAYPVFTDTSTLTWSSATAIEPTARLTDSSSTATLQQFLVGTGIVMAIGLSPLGNQIYDWWKRRFREPGTR
jgi:hypothetical protein